LRAFVELVPFSVTLVASHGCTLLKLLHHGIMVILRRLDFALHARETSTCSSSFLPLPIKFANLL
jgi:hypothetical protein